MIQAAGRANREGRQPLADSTLTVFAPAEHSPPSEVAAVARAMEATAAKFGPEALLTPEAIRDWFAEVYWRAGPALLDKEAILLNFTASPGSVRFDYRSVAEAYRMVKDSQAPVIIPSEGAERPLAQLSVDAISSGRIARELQPFTVQIPARDRGVLRQNGKGDF